MITFDPVGDAVSGPATAPGPERPAPPSESGVTRAHQRRLGQRPVWRRPLLLALAGVGAFVVAAGVTAAVSDGRQAPEPAAVIGTAVPGASTGSDVGAPADGAPGDGAAETGSAETGSAGGAPAEVPRRAPATEVEPTVIPRRGDVDPAGAKASGYLAALREAGIPTSRSGLAETEAAAVVCEQLDAGADEDALVRALPAVLPTVTRSQAATVVTIAKDSYC